MNTVAHVMVASAVLARREAPRRNWAMIAGALLPDISIYIFFVWSRIMGWSGEETWGVRYWTEPWQTLGAISNSFILAALILAVAAWRNWLLIVVMSVAVLLHLALDLPLHADDAHRHFWPVSDWRFVSPVSYWDPKANGLLGVNIETLFVLLSAIILWRRFAKIWWRASNAIIVTLQMVLLSAAFVFHDAMINDSSEFDTKKPRSVESEAGPFKSMQNFITQPQLSSHQR